MTTPRSASGTPSSIDSDSLRWLLLETRPFVRLHALSQGCVIAATALALTDPLLMKWLVDDVLPARRVWALPVVAAALIGLYVTRRALDAAAVLGSMRAVTRMVFGIRVRLLQRLHTLPASYYDHQSAGDLLYRLDQDVAQVGTLGGDLLPLVARLITTALFVLTTMFLLDAVLAATVLPLVPLFVVLRWWMRGGLRTRADSAQTHAAAVSSFLQEHLPAVVQIQLLGAESAKARQFAKLAAASARADVARRRTELLFGSLLSLVIFAGMATVLGAGGYRVMTEHLSVGSLVAFYGYTLQLFIPFYAVVDLAARFERVAASVRRIREIEEAVPSITDRPVTTSISRATFDVTFDAVSFGYGSNGGVLHDVSFHIDAGERIGIVGPSGSGKSSIGKLLARLYDVNAGAVLIGRHDVRRLALKDLRRAIALVPQEARLFDATLLENVRCGLRDVRMRELEDVMTAAQLQSVIERLPHGWNEPLGPEGRRLSGGERQRVALARALLRKPALLVLDEATAGLDADTEHALLQSLMTHLPGSTLLLISHRRSALSLTQRVMRLQRGRLVSCDTRLAG